jgi:hypothetical protein
LTALAIQTARVFQPLLAPARYKGAWGGRGSGKSHFFAEMLIEDALAQPGLLSVCIREVQKSLADSAKRLIERKLSTLQLGEASGFKVYRELIRTPGNGVITFQGMADHTADSIKSDRAVDDAVAADDPRPRIAAVVQLEPAPANRRSGCHAAQQFTNRGCRGSGQLVGQSVVSS